MPPNNIPFADWLMQEIRFHGWSMRELARRSGVSHSTISLVIGGQPPTWDFCAAIAAPLEVSPIEVFLIAGKLSPSDLRRAVLALQAEWMGNAKIQTLISELPLTEQEALRVLLMARLKQ